MKNKIHVLFLLLVCMAYSGISQEFRHPGILHTEEDFARMRKMVEDGVEPWLSGFQKLRSSEFASSAWSPRPTAEVSRCGSGCNIAVLYRDVAAAYQNALMWKATGDSAHANKAVEIMNGWSKINTRLTGDQTRYLASGLFGYQFANAAEIMRDYPGFNLERFQTYMLDVFYYPLIERFLLGNHHGLDHNDACISNYWANWDLCNMAAMIAIGVLCDNREIYNKGIEYFKGNLEYFKDYTVYDKDRLGNGTIREAVPYVHSDTLAQWQESGRDQGHSILGVGLMASFCEVAWNQGDDMYGYDDSRFRKGAEYVAKYNMWEDVPYTPYSRTGPNCSYDEGHTISGKVRGEARSIWEMIYNHYAYRVGQGESVGYIALQAARHRPEGGPGGHPTTFDQPGFGTLTHTLVDPEGRINIEAYADTYVSSSEPDTNYGDEISMVSESSEDKYAFMQFDLNDFQAENFVSARLSLNVKNTYGERVVSLYRVEEEGWKEDSLTWNNKPVIGNDLGSVTLSTSGEVVEWDITSLLIGELAAGDGKVSLAVKYATNGEPAIEFYTRESNGKGPAIQIEVANILPKIDFGVRHILLSPEEEIVLNVRAFDMDGEVQSVEFFIDGESIGGDISYPYDAKIKPFNSPGIHSITAVATDDKGAVKTSAPVVITVTDGLIGSNPYVHYTFDSTSIDVTGGGKDATLEEGSGYFSEDTLTSVALDGVDDYVSLPNGILSELDSFTICTWVNVNQTASWSRIFDFGQNTSSNMFLAMRGDYLRFKIRTGASSYEVASEDPLTNGAWHHVAVTQHKNSVFLYIDGELTGTGSNVTINPSDLGGTTQNYIGRSLWSNDPYLKGRIDDFRIYNKALSNSQLKRVMGLNDNKMDAPYVYVSSPGQGEEFIKGSDITITVTAEDLDGDVASISYYQGDELLGTLSNSSFLGLLTWPNVQLGDYKIYVVATDNDANQSVSDTVNISVVDPLSNDMNKQAHIIYPNPTDGWVKVMVNTLDQDMMVKVLDMSGKEVLSSKMVEQNMNIDLRHIQRGVYLIEISSNSGTIARYKLVKN